MADTARRVVVIGAGPAGLTAALLLAGAGEPVLVAEATDDVGGISRTVERDGWRFDLGGHRFFTKVPEVERLWHEILDDEEFLRRPRLSRILYRGRLFDYPLKPVNALRGLGVAEAVRCVGSYAAARIRPPRDQSTFEGWVAARFGYRLYRIFFKTYTEKVWGVPATQIQADWAAQRIRNLSLSTAVLDAFGLRRRGAGQVTTLIDEFQYPRYGPGMMWQRARQLAERAGAEVRLNSPVHRLHRDRHGVYAVSLAGAGAEPVGCRAVISSMPLPDLVRGMDPPPAVRRAADGLSYRDFLTVALPVPAAAAFPDNWIYVHTPGVRVGRVQNFGSWSPYLVQHGQTCLGLEYFVNAGDELWSAPDPDLVRLARRELAAIRLVRPEAVDPDGPGYVVRVPKAYPVYDEGYTDRVAVIRQWLAEAAPNVAPVGRNGMHKYNNQDHSMYTAMLAVDNLINSGRHDLWSVNVESSYHEERAGTGTGRAAPILPARLRGPHPAGRVA